MAVDDPSCSESDTECSIALLPSLLLVEKRRGKEFGEFPVFTISESGKEEEEFAILHILSVIF